MRKYILIIGLVCCVGCNTNNSRKAQQAIIQKLEWGHIIIQMPDGTLKETTEGEDWWFTPQGCGEWNYKELGREFEEQQIGHVSNGGPGILPYAIKGLLKEDQGPNIVVVVSTGVHDDLGVNNLTKDYLQDFKDNDRIEEYYILNSKEVPAQHNACVRAGKQVYTLLHTTC